DASSVRLALGVAAAGLLAGLLAVGRYRLRPTEGFDVTPSAHWPDPVLASQPDPAQTPVLVTVAYRVPPERAAEFVEEMQAVARSRRRGGARRWSLWRDAAEPERFVETYVVGSWQ